MNELVKLPFIDFLNKISVTTGGRFYAANGDDFSEAFQKIADELKKQYLIGFYPKDTENTKSNNIDIKIDKADVVVRARRKIRLKTPKAENK